jgi:hypothetical protein
MNSIDVLLPRFGVYAEQTFSTVRRMISEAHVGRLKNIGTYLCSANADGTVILEKPLGAFGSHDLMEEARQNCHQKISLLSQEPGFVSSWQCGASAEKSEEGVVRSLDKLHLVGSDGLPAGGWNEAFATVVLHRIDRQLMPLTRVHEIRERSQNQWIRPLMKACSLPL